MTPLTNFTSENVDFYFHPQPRLYAAELRPFTRLRIQSVVFIAESH